MAYGNNRAGAQPRAHFQLAGGSLIKFRHPYFIGMIDEGGSSAIDEIDISACCKLEGRFFEANQNQDSARQVVLIDGSTVTISNKMLNGTITIPAVKTTGKLATGDFIAACQLIQSVGDTVGGILTKTDYIDGKALTKVYYGVTVQRCPVDNSEGNDVAVYNVQLLYSGWMEAESGSDSTNEKSIWAVGSQEGIKGFYSPYKLQNAEGKSGTNEQADNKVGRALESTDLAPTSGKSIADNIADGADNKDEVSDAIKDGGTWADVISGGTRLQATKASS